MKCPKTIRLLYQSTLEDLVNSNYIRVFLETLGIFVWEENFNDLKKVKDLKNNIYKFDNILIFDEKKEQFSEKTLYIEEFLNVREPICTLSKENQKELLRKILKYIFNTCELDILEEYIDYYVEKNLFRHLIFIKNGMAFRLDEMKGKETLLEAYNKVQIFKNTNQTIEYNFYLEYAKFKMAILVNQL